MRPTGSAVERFLVGSEHAALLRNISRGGGRDNIQENNNNAEDVILDVQDDNIEEVQMDEQMDISEGEQIIKVGKELWLPSNESLLLVGSQTQLA